MEATSDPDESGTSEATRALGDPPAANTSLSRFWLLTSAASVSELGNTFLSLAMPSVILAGTGSKLLAALSLAMQYLPFIFAPVLGTLVDRYERRRVFLLSELMQGALVALMPLLLSAKQVASVLVLLLFAGYASVVSNLTSDFGLLPMLASPDRVKQAYSRYATATQTARCLGPAVAGLVLATLGGHWALWIDAATFLATALASFALPRNHKPSHAEPGFLRMQIEGFRSFRQLSAVHRLTLVLSLQNLGAAATPTIMVVLAEGTWRWSTDRVGLMAAAGAAGSALGSWLSGHLWARAPSEWRIGLWFTVCAGGCALLLFPWPMVVVVGFCALSAGAGGMNVTTNEYRFKVIPEEVAGRVNAVMRAFIVGAASLSALFLGWTVSLPEQALRFGPALAGSALAAILWMGARGTRTAIE